MREQVPWLLDAETEAEAAAAVGNTDANSDAIDPVYWEKLIEKRKNGAVAEATTVSSSLSARNTQELVIMIALLIAGILLLTLIGIGVLCCCSSFWSAVTEGWWKMMRKVRRRSSIPMPPPGSRKMVHIDDAEAKIRSGLMKPTSIDSSLLDLGEDPPTKSSGYGNGNGSGSGNGNATSEESVIVPIDHHGDSTDARISRELFRSRTQGSVDSTSSESPLVGPGGRKVSEDMSGAMKSRSANTTPMVTRASSTRISTDLGTIDPALYEEWHAPTSSTMVTTSSRKISVLPRSHSTTGAQTPGSPHMDSRGKLYLSIKYDKNEAKLIVAVQRAEGLPPRDFSGTADSFVKVLLLPDRKPKYQTKTQKKTTDPVFNETFEFTVQPDQLPLRTLVFSVHDFDRFSRSCLLGSCAIDMSAIHTQITHDSIDFDVLISNVCGAGHAVEELGEILVSLSYLTNVERLTICVMKCQNLKPMDLSGSADPYVIVEVYHAGRRIKKRKTDVKKRTLVPVFNEAFIFDIPIADIPLVCVVVKVYDYDRLSADDLIGTIVLGEACTGPGRAHWLEAIANQRRSIAKWHKLCGIETIKSYLPTFMENVPLVSEFSLARLRGKLHIGTSQSASVSSQNDSAVVGSTQSLLSK